MGKRASDNIILVGFSFTGKTVAGQAAARRLGWRFVDTDDEVVARAGKAIPDIFAQDGEARFRALEREALARVLAGEGQVVATGGGAILDAGNRQLMKERGVVVCLEARPETIHRRLLADQKDSPVVRPLLAGDDPLARIRALKEFRQPFYALADWTVHTDALTPAQVAREVVHGYRRLAGRLQADTSAPASSPEPAASFVVRASSPYPVYVGWDILGDIGRQMRNAGLQGQAHLVSDDAVLPRYGPVVEAGLRQAGFPVGSIAIPAGETSKTLASAARLYDWLVQRRAERGDVVVALGGGVVGDLAGFVAATFLRGLAWVAVPTSLVAMVDASIGGKTAVNLPQAKNLVGAFHQPRLVLADVATLRTLPQRELVSGWAEVVKHGLVLDPPLFDLIEREAHALLALEPEVTVEVVKQSATLKGQVVAEDERETGRRIILNFGHTIGHALEAVTGFQGFLHGEAVAVGMVGEARLSQRLGLLPPEMVTRLRDLLQSLGLPVSAPGIAPDALMGAMALDKKVQGKAIRWVLLSGLGQPVVRSDVSASLVREVLETVLSSP